MILGFTLILSMINMINGACLTASQLESLGFTGGLAEPVENTGEGYTCKTEKKVCLDPLKIKDQIKANLKRCKEARNNQMKKVGERLEKDGKKIKEVVEGMVDADSEGKTKKGGKFKRPPKDEQMFLVPVLGYSSVVQHWW